MQFESISLLIIAIAALVAGVVFQIKKRSPGTTSLSIIALSITVWGVSNFLIGTREEAITSINFVCMALAATGQFYFTLSYTNRLAWVNNRVRWMHRVTGFLFILIPAVIPIIFWAPPLRDLFSAGSSAVAADLNEIYIISILASSVLFFVDTFARRPHIQLFNSGMVMLAAVLPLISRISFIFGVSLGTDIFLSVLSYSLALAAFAYQIFNVNDIDSNPITRDLAVESMDDGWMIVDKQNRVVDLNSAAEEMIEQSYETIYGQPVNQILTDWADISNSTKGNKERDMLRRVKSQKDWRYFNIRISKLTDQNNANFGHLIIWRDITRRKLADDARQQARDELIVLMNAVSNAASRAKNLEEFLDETSFQIVYSFSSRAIAVFLAEKDDEDQPNLVLRNHFGLSPSQIKELSKKKFASAINNWLSHNVEYNPVTINNYEKSPEIPASLKKLDFELDNVALIPLFVRTEHEKQLTGCLCLGRDATNTFSPDEIVRLTAISSHTATLIDNDRRRQFATKLMERDRLQRDLHDSVSQKLYGLVALTEAAQAGIEAGSKISPMEVLSRIGENARQAVKEMRLFLYEMQPAELKDGLVSAVLHRLNAVEGRASIVPTFTADDKIRLTKDTETALYQIIQEALNNILRHAFAKKVSITLSQTRSNVILAISDDGRGFDIDKIEKGGRGLTNMEERVRQLKGKFEITSTPGQGTRITVTIGKKR